MIYTVLSKIKNIYNYSHCLRWRLWMDWLAVTEVAEHSLLLLAYYLCLF